MPVTNRNKLLFFNKEGDPYNFELDSDDIYKGKLLFDENSNDTYKTLGIYMFEEVEPFDFSDYFSMNKMEFYNTSGINFQPFTSSGDTISNISSVNSSDSFYSKWVFGDDLDQKYPKGTIVSFSGITFNSTSTDFDNKYYTVLDNKPDAILVNTQTVNSDWNLIFNSANTSTIISHNAVELNDYDGTIYNTVTSWTLHDNKKFTFIGTDGETNNGIKVYADNANMKTIYQTYNTDDFSGLTGDVLRFDFELKTERPKLYQGSAYFNLSGGSAIITFDRTLNSLINLEGGDQMIFEDYDDNPILSTNPIFTIVSGTEDEELYTGNIEFVKELNTNKTFIKNFGDKGLSAQNFIKNTTPTEFNRYASFFTTYYPKRFFEYDYYINITGSTSNFTYNLSIGDTIQLSATTETTGTSRHKNNERKLKVLDIVTFKDIRIKYWTNKIKNSVGWLYKVKEKAIANKKTLDQQIIIESNLMYNEKDININSSDFIPVSQRQEKLKVEEYVIPESTVNEYTLYKLIDKTNIKTLVCTMSPPYSETFGIYTNYETTFTKNIIAYDTENILSFTQPILRMNSDDERIYKSERLDYWKDYIINDSLLYGEVVSAATSNTFSYSSNPSAEIERQLNLEANTLYNSNDTLSGISYKKTIDAFNDNYGTYLKDSYGILVYYNSGSSNIFIHSLYSLNDDGTNITYDKYFTPTVYLNDQNVTGFTTPGITNEQIGRMLIEFDTQLYKEEILPNEPEKFDVNYYNEIYLELVDNGTTDFGFQIELNDIQYYTKFDTDTQTTIKNFIDTYSTLFDNIGLSLESGTTILSQYGTSGSNYYSATGVSWVTGGTITTISGYTLVIQGKYPNVNVRTLNVKVNLYSKYEIINEIDNVSLLISGNELEKANPTTIIGSSTETFGTNNTMFDYGFATGMIIILSGSTHKENNKSYNIIGMTETILELSYQGLFYDDGLVTTIYPPTPYDIGKTMNSYPNLSIDVERFLRKPRESANKDIYYSWRFTENNDGKFSDDIFFYDVTGEHLKPYEDNEDLVYTGTKPLWDTSDACSERNKNIILRDEPNKKTEYVNDPTKQQTVFKGKDGEYCLEFLLDEYNSISEYDYIPEPLQVFLGFKSNSEGVSQTNIVLDKIENIIFSGYTNSTTYPNNIEFNFNSNGVLTITTNQVNFNFDSYGFESKQPITIDFVDQSRTGTTIFQNYGTFTIKSLNSKQIMLEPYTRDFVYDEDIKFIPFTTTATTESFYYEIKVQPNPILYLSVYGETEIEDERFSVVLNNLGIRVQEEDEHIFKQSDINEYGIDYILLNQKRKEMLVMYPEIYNYIGSYKAIINSINFFGWNDLQLNEYYKNIDVNSSLYQKLFKVEIPDIFDSTIVGWTENNYIKGKYQTGKFKKTNLFNLTYNITDEEGNNTLLYSLDEVQTKLSKLKRWLKRNVLPLSTNLIDITGVANVISQNYQNYDVSNQIKKIYCGSEVSIVNFVYTETLNFVDNYLFEIEFYTRGTDNPSGWTCKIQTFSKAINSDELIPQKDYKLMKNDLSNFSFNIDKNVDQYIYIETVSYNDYGVGQKYNKMINTSTSKNYLLVNNRFHIPDYSYLNVDDRYYWFDDEGHIFLDD